MTDNITLPREVVEAVLRIVERSRDWSDVRQSGDCAAILRKALAAEQPKPSDDRKAMKEALRILTKPEPERRLRWQVSDACDILRTALAAEQPKPEPVRCNPAAMRTAASSPAVLFITELDSPDAEALRRDAERYKWVLNWLWRYGLLSRESFGDWFVLRKPNSIGLSVGYGKTEDAAIDAAMGDKT